nr:four-carbon acid sugar kinase family protein [Kineococcus siccus]
MLQRGRPCTVLLGAAAAAPAHAGTLVVDVDHRCTAPGPGHAAVTAAVAALAPAGLLAVKLDSLWRGHVGATVSALQDNGFGVVLAGALPALGRTVVGGVPLVDGVALAGTGLWDREPTTAPAAVRDLLAAAPQEVGLAAVRSPGLAGVLRGVVVAGACAVLDAETDDDLAAAARAAALLAGEGHRVALVGSAALVAAAADATPAADGSCAPAVAEVTVAELTVATGPRATAVVAGSGAAATAAQLAYLLAAAPGAAPVLVTPVADALVPEAPAADPLVLSLAGAHPDARAAVVRLAERAVAVVGHRDLVLTGGETARAVLDRLGVDLLRPVAQLSHGAVVSLARDGRLVATKPGSFGGPAELHDLVLLLRRLRTAAPGHPRTEPSAPRPLEML